MLLLIAFNQIERLEVNEDKSQMSLLITWVCVMRVYLKYIAFIWRQIKMCHYANVISYINHVTCKIQYLLVLQNT